MRDGESAVLYGTSSSIAETGAKPSRPSFFSSITRHFAKKRRRRQTREFRAFRLCHRLQFAFRVM